MPCVYLPGPAPAVTVANNYYVQSVNVINTENALYILCTQWLHVHVLNVCGNK